VKSILHKIIDYYGLMSRSRQISSQNNEQVEHFLQGKVPHAVLQVLHLQVSAIIPY